MTGRLAVVVGDVINDIVVRPVGPLTPRSDTPSSVLQSPGGSGANQAAWMGSFGARVRFAGRAGAHDADLHRSALISFGVDARISADPERATGAVVAFVTADGERSMYTDRGASAHLGPSDLPLDLLDGASLLHVSGYALFEAVSRGGVLRLWEAAKAMGLAVSVDPASLSGLRQMGPAEFLCCTDGATVAFPNHDEGRALSGADRPDAIADALLAHYETVALKLGPLGALVASRDGLRIERRPRAVGAVDSTGGGDAFCAGFLSALLAGAGLEQAADWGMEASSRAVQVPGGRPRPGHLHEP